MPTRKPRIIVLTVEGAAKQKYAISPSAEDFMKKRLKKAQAIGAIKNESDFVFCQTALEAGGIMVAQTGRGRLVTAPGIKSGYDKYVRAMGLECPVYRCMRRSIIDRAEQLKGELPVLSALLMNKK